MSYIIEIYQGEAKRGSFEWPGDYQSVKEEAGRYFCDDKISRIAVRKADGEMLFSCLNMPHHEIGTGRESRSPAGSDEGC